MNLYEIDQEIMNCVDMETGEIIDPARLDELQMDRDIKIENIACWIKNLYADAEAFKTEKQSLQPDTVLILPSTMIQKPLRCTRRTTRTPSITVKTCGRLILSRLAMGIRLDLHGSHRTVSTFQRRKVESQKIRTSEVLHG